jgi:hypothetical protein
MSDHLIGVMGLAVATDAGKPSKSGADLIISNEHDGRIDLPHPSPRAAGTRRGPAAPHRR